MIYVNHSVAEPFDTPKHQSMDYFLRNQEKLLKHVSIFSLHDTLCKIVHVHHVEMRVIAKKKKKKKKKNSDSTENSSFCPSKVMYG